MEKEAMQEKPREEREPTAHSKKHLQVEWSKSEWFKIYLQMARRDPRTAEEG